MTRNVILRQPELKVTSPGDGQLTQTLGELTRTLVGLSLKPCNNLAKAQGGHVSDSLGKAIIMWKDRNVAG